MSFARFFYCETEQARICRYIHNISRKDIEKNINAKDIWYLPGKEFIFGAELYKNQPNENRYYHFYFREHSCQDRQSIKKGIVEVSNKGKLNILDANFDPLPTNLELALIDGQFELRTPTEIERAKKSDFIGKCMVAVAAVEVAAFTAAGIYIGRKMR